MASRVSLQELANLNAEIVTENIDKYQEGEEMMEQD
jgi:hypothetical protein